MQFKEISLIRNVFYMLFSVLVLVAVVIVSTSVVSAAEMEETESQTDFEQNERLNNLEARLEELGYSIDELENCIVSINERLDLSEQERLAIRDQLDLLIIGINDLCNYSIDYLNNFDTAVADSGLKAVENNTLLTQLYDSSVQLNDNTVSGNAIITAFGDDLKTDMQNISETSITEFNETLLRTNTLLSYLFVLMLLVLVLIIVYGIGSILKNIINRSVL